MGFWGWVGTVAAIWFAASILAAGAWALLKRATRSDEDRLREELADLTAVLDATTGRAEDELLDAIHRMYVADGLEQVEAFLKAGDR